MENSNATLYLDSKLQNQGQDDINEGETWGQPPASQYQIHVRDNGTFYGTHHEGTYLSSSSHVTPAQTPDTLQQCLEDLEDLKAMANAVSEYMAGEVQPISEIRRSAEA